MVFLKLCLYKKNTFLKSALFGQFFHILSNKEIVRYELE